ncbi:dodecin [Legionella shakespearei]|uniref:Protein with a Dodecin-like topology n=1 Tax=Legionella shakespearei DSM 23087 TaxID=1122169 RepID=A0A0W0Z0X2_9GAMM|nr:dodecin [Legionella shakespearei]KTD62789.1 protein with a Dodecin-like topology [Legionella shakespearei DSM 23087]
MNDKVYQIIELVGTSQEGIEQAIDNAISQASKTHGKLDWFEVLETRGFIDDNKVKYYQVHVKIGCNK